MLSYGNLVSKNVQIGCAVTLIDEALDVLGSRGRSIRSSRSSHDRRLNLSVLVPFVEGGDVNHLQLTVVRIRQGQVLQETRKHRSFGRIRASPASQSRVVRTGSTNGSVIESRHDGGNEIDPQLLCHLLVLLVHSCLESEKAVVI